MDIHFRPAQPEDAEQAIPLIYSSGPKTFDYVFAHRTPIDSQEFLRQAFIKGGTEFGYSSHTVGEYEGKVVAIGTSFSRADKSGQAAIAIKQIVQGYGFIKGLGVIRRGLQIESYFMESKDDRQYIAHIGVTPDLRGQGIGEQLMRYLIKHAQALGRNAASLDVSCENPRAQVLYERLGFVVTRDLPLKYSNSTSYVPSHRRMELLFNS